jgi:hypothetical protein
MKTAKRPALNAWRRACLQVLAIVARCPACRENLATLNPPCDGDPRHEHASPVTKR